MGIGGAENFVTSELCGDNLADNVSVGEPNDKTVLGRVVFVLGLSNEALARIIVGFARPSALVFGLEAACPKGQRPTCHQRRFYLPEVRTVLDKLSERHGNGRPAQMVT